jgi:hypothetical protein
MSGDIQNGLLRIMIVIVIGIIFSVSLYRNKARIAAAFMAILIVLLFSIGALENIMLLYGSYVEITATTNGIVHYKAGKNLKYYFYYEGKEYTSSLSVSYKDIEKVMIKDGRFIVRISKAFPFFNRLDIDRPIIE